MRLRVRRFCGSIAVRIKRAFRRGASRFTDGGLIHSKQAAA